MKSNDHVKRDHTKRHIAVPNFAASGVIKQLKKFYFLSLFSSTNIKEATTMKNKFFYLTLLAAIFVDHVVVSMAAAGNYVYIKRNIAAGNHDRTVDKIASLVNDIDSRTIELKVRYTPVSVIEIS